MNTTNRFTKTTSKGLVLTVTRDGSTVTVTIDGKAIPAGYRILDVPRTIAGKTVMAQVGSIGLTREEYEAFRAVYDPPAPPPVDAKYTRATPMTRELAAELRAWNRGAERKAGLDED